MDKASGTTYLPDMHHRPLQDHGPAMMMQVDFRRRAADDGTDDHEVDLLQEMVLRSGRNKLSRRPLPTTQRCLQANPRLLPDELGATTLGQDGPQLADLYLDKLHLSYLSALTEPRLRQRAPTSTRTLPTRTSSTLSTCRSGTCVLLLPLGRRTAQAHLRGTPARDRKRMSGGAGELPPRHQRGDTM